MHHNIYWIGSMYNVCALDCMYLLESISPILEQAASKSKETLHVVGRTRILGCSRKV